MSNLTLARYHRFLYIMPQEGIFVKVLQNGYIWPGDEIRVLEEGEMECYASAL